MGKTLTGQWLDELTRQLLVAMYISRSYVLHKPLDCVIDKVIGTFSQHNIGYDWIKGE